MKKTTITAGVLLLIGGLSLFAATKKSPVLMTVDGKDVTLAEFEYMYNKNNQQQLAKQPLDTYLDMFTVYKLKVADAINEGIDTTKSFQKEYAGYRNDLFAPFLVDTVAEEAAAKGIYERMKTNVKASHIMLARGDNAEAEAKISARLDSIRSCILAGQSFEDLALKYSIDRSVTTNKGSMGYITIGRFPQEFEDVCYATAVDSISPVFTTDFGFHIVKVYERRPDPGQVNVEHILKLFPQNATGEQKAQVKHTVDSIYALVKAGGDFEQLARENSEDGSAKQDGLLPWFGVGQMVPQFEKVAFDLADGEISEPFETRYGIHIIKKLGSKSLGSYADMHEQVMRQLRNSSLSTVGRDSKVEQLKKQHSLMRNVDTEKLLYADVTSPAQFDSVFIAKYKDSNLTLFTIEGRKYPVSLLIDRIKGFGKMRDEQAKKFLNGKINEIATEAVLNYERDCLENSNEDFKNLLNEYRDGMLLFEVSNQKVWNKAASDVAGLEKYFEEHRNEYKWTSPKYKGYLIQTTSDSISKLIKQQIMDIGEDSLARTLRKQFGKDNVKIEKVLVAKSENAMVDAEKFGGEKVKPQGKYTDYFVIRGKILTQPEELNDVRGLVVSDYQNALEAAWVAELKEKYKVKINQKTLKMVK
ncbi:MAG: peptidylprolyl isomerase [Candidatus Limisoma sp.]